MKRPQPRESATVSLRENYITADLGTNLGRTEITFAPAFSPRD